MKKAPVLFNLLYKPNSLSPSTLTKTAVDSQNSIASISPPTTWGGDVV